MNCDGDPDPTGDCPTHDGCGCCPTCEPWEPHFPPPPAKPDTQPDTTTAQDEDPKVEPEIAQDACAADPNATWVDYTASEVLQEAAKQGVDPTKGIEYGRTGFCVTKEAGLSFAGDGCSLNKADSNSPYHFALGLLLMIQFILRIIKAK